MAGILRLGLKAFARNQPIRLQAFSIQQVECSSVVAGSTQHTLSVRKRIDKTREKNLLGGGQKRIEKQHAKVCKKLTKFCYTVENHIQYQKEIEM